MKTIFYYDLSGGCCVSVNAIGADVNYARQCWDGSDSEFEDLIQTADQPLDLYIVSSGLAGCYMRDNVSVYTSKTQALRAANDEVRRDREENEDFDETEGN